MEEAVRGVGRLPWLLEKYSLVWCLDVDCLITDLRQRIEDVPGLGPHASICEEGVFDAVPLNGGSVVWKSTDGTRSLVDEIVSAEPEWRGFSHNIQQWLAMHLDRLKDRLTVCHKRAFNGVHHHGMKVWEPGDFVYHPCGMSAGARCAMLTDHLRQVIS
jgi:hypothetical protein